MRQIWRMMRLHWRMATGESSRGGRSSLREGPFVPRRAGGLAERCRRASKPRAEIDPIPRADGVSPKYESTHVDDGDAEGGKQPDQHDGGHGDEQSGAPPRFGSEFDV